MVSKNISSVKNAGAMHWVGDGLPVYQAINPSGLGKVLNPFILLDYGAPYKFEPYARPRGVGLHPHRGFETVTIAFQGEITHSDSTGQSGTIHAGDVQWMTAGSGLEHQEKHSDKFTREGGTLEMLQLWVNLPKKHKMIRPRYQAITKDEIPHIKLEGGAGSIDLIAGEYEATNGAATTFTPLYMWSVKLNAGAKIKLPSPKDWVTALFVRSGEATSNDKQLVFKDLAIYSNTGDEVEISTEKGVELVYLSGEPIREPMVSLGPMVMNTQEELYKAFEDYDDGKFAGMKGKGIAYDI